MTDLICAIVRNKKKKDRVSTATNAKIDLMWSHFHFGLDGHFVIFALEIGVLLYFDVKCLPTMFIGC